MGLGVRDKVGVGVRVRVSDGVRVRVRVRATLARCCSKSFRQMPRKLTYMRGVAPCGTCDSCSLTICLTSAGRSAAARCSSGTPAKTCSGSRSMLGTSQLPIHSMEQRM